MLAKYSEPLYILTLRKFAGRTQSNGYVSSSSEKANSTVAQYCLIGRARYVATATGMERLDVPRSCYRSRHALRAGVTARIAQLTRNATRSWAVLSVYTK